MDVRSTFSLQGTSELSLGETSVLDGMILPVHSLLLVLTVEVPTKKARGYLLREFYGRIERLLVWQSSCFFSKRFSRNLAIHIVP